MANKQRYIHKGISKTITAHGGAFVVGETYIATLYYSSNTEDYRCSTSAVAVANVSGENGCVFTFSADDTELLKRGNVQLDVYDSNRNRIKQEEHFAIVKSSSLSD